MGTRDSFTWRRSARVAAVLAVLAAGLPAWAGTLTIVNLPATGTDAAIGISTDKVYTHTFDFGSNAPVTINGVAFEQGPTASFTAAYTRTSKQGYGYTITDTRTSISIAIHAGNDPSAQVDGNSAGMFRDMIYHSGSTTIGAGIRLTLSNLTPGATYSFRLYYRAWGAASATRTISFRGDGGHNGVFSDTLDIELDAGGAHYFDYTYTTDDADVQMQFLTNDNNNGIHFYGITNELLRGPGTAQYPSPADKATDVYRAATLAWTPGETAATHDVYFGTSAADVEAASVTTPLGVLVSAGQSEVGFDPGRLELGRTYYWRVDEVNAAPDHTIFQGGVWSFTVEPASYAIAGTNITATASSTSGATMGPEKTIDGSGLTGDQHGTGGEQMWLSAADPTQAAWIQYAFDKVYKLDRMLVWNSNQVIEAMIGFGAKDVKVEYSTDGTTWTALGDFVFAQASGAATYTSNTTVDFAGAAAKYVKLTIGSNWGGVVKQYGLSEVRFLQIPVVAAYPSPAAGAAGVAPRVALSWRPGREAGTHQVFLGTDAANLPLVATTNAAAYETDLSLGQTYYWKVIEVNEAKTPATWESPVWSFATAKSIAVEDFESYNDREGQGTRIYETWIDGFGTKTNGAQVGYLQAPFVEQTIFFNGKQSMPLMYDNTAPIASSEAERTFGTAQDWTKYGFKGLSLHFFGDPNNSGQLYVKINGTKVLYSGAAADLKIAAWMPWTVDLAAAGVNVQKVTKLAVGVEGSGAKGKLYVDAIGLYPSTAAVVTPVDPGTTGLVAYYKLDGDAKDSAGTHHGTLAGNPQPFLAGKLGQAFNVTADLTYITVPYAADLSMSTFTIAAWVKVTDKSGIRGILGTRFNGEYTFDLKVDAVRIHGDVGNGTAWLNSATDVVAAQGGSLTLGVWHHIAYAIDDATDTAQLYLDGARAATATFSGTPMFMKAGEELRIGNSYGTAEYMRGAIDDMRIYNTALSEAQIASLAGRPGPVFQAP